MNEVNKVGKGIPVRDFSELEYVSRASLLLVCEKVGVKINHAINKKDPFWKRITEKDIAVLRRIYVKLMILSMDDGNMTVPS